MQNQRLCKELRYRGWRGKSKLREYFVEGIVIKGENRGNTRTVES
jgi:hypothetical protein